MTARKERELFQELCSALKAEPPDSTSLERIVKQWKDLHFDTDFDELVHASEILRESALDAQKVQELVNRVNAQGFLTQYTGSADFEPPPEPDSYPTCLVALYTCLQPWSAKIVGTKGPYAEAWELLARHAATVRAALDSEDEEMLRSLFKWNGSGAVLESCDRALIAEARAWLAQQDARRCEWLREINCGRVPDELGLSLVHAELVSAAGVKHPTVVPLILDTELFAWAQDFEERAFKHRVKVDPSFRRYLVSDTQDLQLPPDVESLTVRIGLARQVLQILRVGADDDHDGRATLSCVSMSGTEVARLHLDLSATALSGLVAAVARESGREPCTWEFVFPKAATLTGYKSVSSRHLPQCTLLSQLL